MRIMMDIDGVLADFNRDYVQLLRRVTGKKCPLPKDWEPTEWNYPPGLGFTEEECAKAWEIINDPKEQFWEDLDAYPEANAIAFQLERMKHDGWEVFFVTTRTGKTAKMQTEHWLSYIGIDYPAVIVSDKKGPICRALGVTVAVDDRDKNCIELREWCPEAVINLRPRPWNCELQRACDQYHIHCVADVAGWLRERAAKAA